jgi:hypothetical protein
VRRWLAVVIVSLVLVVPVLAFERQYKELEGKAVAVEGLSGRADAEPRR